MTKTRVELTYRAIKTFKATFEEALQLSVRKTIEGLNPSHINVPKRVLEEVSDFVVAEFSKRCG